MIFHLLIHTMEKVWHYSSECKLIYRFRRNRTLIWFYFWIFVAQKRVQLAIKWPTQTNELDLFSTYLPLFLIRGVSNSFLCVVLQNKLRACMDINAGTWDCIASMCLWSYLLLYWVHQFVFFSIGDTGFRLCYRRSRSVIRKEKEEREIETDHTNINGAQQYSCISKKIQQQINRAINAMQDACALKMLCKAKILHNNYELNWEICFSRDFFHILFG